MQGPIENAMTLVAAGNAYLSGRDLSGFWPNAQTFRFLELCEFRDPPPPGAATDAAFPLRAADPLSWFASLKPWCRGLRLHFAERPLEPNQMPGLSPRKLVGFVGGGPRWLIECVGPKGSEVWEGFQRTGDKNNPQRRLWLATYIKQGDVRHEDVTPNTLAEGEAALRGVLPEIEAYARDDKLDNFADLFARALASLDAPVDPGDAYLTQYRRWTGAADPELRTLAAVMDAWVFGGMGSWNDTGGGERYEQLSERLFDALCGAICGIANSSYRG